MSLVIEVKCSGHDLSTLEAGDYVSWGDDSFLSKLGNLALMMGLFDLSGIDPEIIPDDIWENEEIDRSLLPEKVTYEVIAYDRDDPSERKRFVSMRAGSQEPVFAWLDRNPRYEDYVAASREALGV